MIIKKTTHLNGETVYTEDEYFKWASGSTFTNDTVMVLHETGRLGIGNDHPSHELGVTGSISASTKIISAALQITAGASSGYVLKSDGSGNATWQTDSGTLKYAADKSLTAGAAGTVTHNLGTTDVIVQVKDPSGNLTTPGTVNNYQANSVDITVSVTGTYRVIIIG